MVDFHYIDPDAGFFIWDGEKERDNIRRHGIGFQKAPKAFGDPYRIITPDQKHSGLEQRWFCVGKVAGRVLTVRFTLREDQTRIFGVGAWRKGKNLYETKISKRP